MSDTHTDDFLDVEPYAVSGTEEPGSIPPPRRKAQGAAVTAGWLVAGLAVGATGVAVWASHSNNTAGSATAATGGQPGAGQQFAPPNAGTGGPPAGGNFGGGGGGPMAGEQHLSGTLGSVGASTFSLTTSTGTASYTIDSATLLVKNGQRVTSLSSLQPGDQVVVHVYPLNGKTHVEMVIDGQ
jgi:hypothetical protein